MELPVIINYGIYGFIAFFALITALSGLVGGFSRQVLRVVTVAVSAVISFIVCTKLYPTVFGFLSSKTTADLIAMINSAGVTLPENIVAFLECLETETGAYLLAIPLLLVAVPVLFILLFVLLNGITKIIHLILCGIFGFTKKNNIFITRILGAAVGFVQGVFVAAVIMLPIAGTVGTLSHVVKTAEEELPDSTNTQVVANVYHAYLDAAENNVAVNILNTKVGFVYEKFITVDVEGEAVKLSDVASDCFNTFVLYGDLAGVDFANLTAENKETINSMVENIGNDKYITSILSGVFRALPRAFDRGLVQFTYDEPLLGFANSFLHVFETSNKDNVKNDLSTTVNILFIVSDSGVFGAEGQGIFDALMLTDENGHSTVTRICKELGRNERFAPIADTLAEMAVQILLDNAGVDGDAKQTVEEITGTLNEVLAIDKSSYETEEEYRAEVSSKIDETLQAEGIPLEEDQLAAVTDYVTTEFEGKEEITEHDIADFMAKYYDVYAGASGDTTVPGTEEN